MVHGGSSGEVRRPRGQTTPVECGSAAGRFGVEENGGKLECAARGNSLDEDGADGFNRCKRGGGMGGGSGDGVRHAVGLGRAPCRSS
jgi:hypothetical protein